MLVLTTRRLRGRQPRVCPWSRGGMADRSCEQWKWQQYFEVAVWLAKNRSSDMGLKGVQRNVHRANAEHDSRSNLVRQWHPQPDDGRDRDDEDEDVRDDIRDCDGNVQDCRIDAIAVLERVGVPRRVYRPAREQEQPGDGDGVAGDDPYHRPYGHPEPLLRRDLEVEGEEGGLAEAVADDEDGRNDVGALSS